MTNQFLEKEVIKNKKHHEIFTNQTIYDLIDTAKILNNNQLSTIDIPIVFDKNLLELFTLSPIFRFPYRKKLHNQAWEQFVAIVILQELKNQLQIEPYNLEELITIFRSSNIDYYLNNQNKFPTREAIFNIIETLNSESIRLHFFILFNSISLNCEISHYLQDNLPFKTMIYSLYNFEVGRIKPPNYQEYHQIKDMFDYLMFEGLKKGYPSSSKRKAKLYPEKPKTKKLTKKN